MLGEAPGRRSSTRQFDWPDAVIPLPFDSPDVGRRLAELDADQPRPGRSAATTSAGRAPPRLGPPDPHRVRHPRASRRPRPAEPASGASRPSRPGPRHRRVRAEPPPPTGGSPAGHAGAQAAVARNALFLVAGQAATTALAIVFSAALGRSLGARTSASSTSSRPCRPSPTSSWSGGSPCSSSAEAARESAAVRRAAWAPPCSCAPPSRSR